MHITDIFIRRASLAIVVNVLILIVGCLAINHLPLREFPAIESGSIVVTTYHPGASEASLQGYVTEPLSRAIATATGVEYTQSETAPGRSVITAKLLLNADSTVALTEVMAKVNEVKYRLPVNATDPIVTRLSSDPTAVMYIGITSDNLSVPQLSDYLTRAVMPQLSAIRGIGSLALVGNQDLALRVWLDPNRMAALNISAADVTDAIRENNIQSATGLLEDRRISRRIKTSTSTDSVSSLQDLVVRSDLHQRITLSDIAEVKYGGKTYQQSAFSKGLPTVFVAVYAAPDGNPLELVNNVKAALTDLQADLPAEVSVDVGFDVTRYINSSIAEIQSSLIEAIVVVVLIMLAFLGSFRVVLVPLITIPLSLIGTAALMQVMGFSINLLSLLAMVLAIGLVVDDAIVVVENVFRHVQAGKRPLDAALLGAREIVKPVIAMTITLAVVYAPIGFVGGLTGSLFSEFAFTLACAVIVSGVVALTLSPLMSGYLINQQTHQSPMVKFVERRFESISRGYHALTLLLLRRRGWLLLGVALIMAATGAMYVNIARELAPGEDQGYVYTAVEGPQQANLAYTETYTSRLNDILMSLPEYSDSFMVNGPAQNEAFGGVILKPWDQRTRSQSEILAEIQGRASAIEGVNVFAFAGASLPGSTGGFPVQVVLRSPDPVMAIYDVSQQALADISQIGLFAVVDTDLTMSSPEMGIHIDREKANRLGVRMADIQQTLELFLSENYINRAIVAGQAYEVIPQAASQFRDSEQDLLNYQVRSSAGALVPLSSLVNIQSGVTANKLYQFNQLNAITLRAIPLPGVSLDRAVGYLSRYLDASLPSGYSYDWLGESRQFVYEKSQLALSFLLSLLIIYLVLSVQFNSARDPIIILVGVPLSMFGALLPLYWEFATLNIYSQIGLVTLIGLISKHGILMVDFANRLQVTEGLSKFDAIVKSAEARLRPILMTTAAMVVGLLPLLTGTGAGAASRFAIGIVIVIGMLVGTVFTLLVLPALYVALASKRGVSEQPVTAMPVLES